jgi:hypothetical protein
MSERFMDIKKQSQKYKEAVKILKELVEQEGTGVTMRAYAEAVYEKSQKNFANFYDGIELVRKSHVCLNRLLGKRCKSGTCDSPRSIPAADHCSEWKKDGKTFIIVSQPYGLSYDSLKETVAFCEENGLEAEVRSGPSWHFPGAVLTIEYKLANK